MNHRPKSLNIVHTQTMQMRTLGKLKRKYMRKFKLPWNR